MRRTRTGKEPMREARRYRIFPDEAQKTLFAKTFGCCRFLYNQMVADRKKAYEETGKTVRRTPAFYKKDYPWLKEVDALALANTQLHVEAAYRKFFEPGANRYPRFKSKRKSRKSYTTNRVNGNIDFADGKLKLPKAGLVKICLHREVPVDGILKSVTVSMEPSGKYYASILYEIPEYENQVPGKNTEEMEILGIDFSMKELAVFSDGTSADYPGYYRKAQKKLAREQRKLSHCQKGSRNYEKQRKKVAVCHEKVRNRRNDFQHKLSRRLADRYDVIVIEDLNMKGMSKALNFGKSVMDNGYGAFCEKLSYKLKKQGKRLVKVDWSFPSSKKCSVCGRVKKELGLDERVYHCECGNHMDRDVNAAINLREEGRRILLTA